MRKLYFQWIVDTVVYGVVGREPAIDGFVDPWMDAMVPICLKLKKKLIILGSHKWACTGKRDIQGQIVQDIFRKFWVLWCVFNALWHDWNIEWSRHENREKTCGGGKCAKIPWQLLMAFSFGLAIGFIIRTRLHKLFKSKKYFQSQAFIYLKLKNGRLHLGSN